MHLRHVPWFALAMLVALSALARTAHAQFDITTPPLEVPIRWCVLDGNAPTLADPGLVNEGSTKAILLRRLARASNNIYLPQANVIFRSGLPAPDPGGVLAAPLVFPVLLDTMTIIGSPGKVLLPCSATDGCNGNAGQKGDGGVEFNDLINRCRKEWILELGLGTTGITAVQIDEFVNTSGTIIRFVGFGSSSL